MRFHCYNEFPQQKTLLQYKMFFLEKLDVHSLHAFGFGEGTRGVHQLVSPRSPRLGAPVDAHAEWRLQRRLSRRRWWNLLSTPPGARLRGKRHPSRKSWRMTGKSVTILMVTYRTFILFPGKKRAEKKTLSGTSKSHHTLTLNNV